MSEVRTIIPEKLFVGVGRKVNGSYPPAALTAWGTDTASKNRMQTVMNSSAQAWTLDNTPQWGIEIGNTVWRDEIMLCDPRGFSTNVKSQLVLELIKNCTVWEGKIQASCVWARQSGVNTILAVGSQAHDVAKLQTRIANSKVTWKQVPVGSWVTLNNGTQGVYLGKYNRLMFDRSKWISNQADNKLSLDISAKVVLWQPTITRHWNPYHTQAVMFVSNAVVAEHTPYTESFTEQQAELKLNELLADPTCWCQASQKGQSTVLATKKSTDLDTHVLTPKQVVCTDWDEVQNYHSKLHYSTDGANFHLVGSKNRNNEVSVYEWNYQALQQNKLMFVSVTSQGYVRAKSQTLHASQVLPNLWVMEMNVTSSWGHQLVNCV